MDKTARAMAEITSGSNRLDDSTDTAHHPQSLRATYYLKGL
jgi:hypothetical protein